MKLSAKAEYACVALLELAGGDRTGQPIRIRNIAANQGIPERFLVQILLVLKSAGLVESTRGAAGGYRLSRQPETITVLEVVEAIDGRSGPSRGEAGTSAHPMGRALSKIWREAEARERVFLNGITLVDVLARVEAPDDSMYQI